MSARYDLLAEDPRTGERRQLMDRPGPDPETAARRALENEPPGTRVIASRPSRGRPETIYSGGVIE